MNGEWDSSQVVKAEDMDMEMVGNYNEYGTNRQQWCNSKVDTRAFWCYFCLIERLYLAAHSHAVSFCTCSLCAPQVTSRGYFYLLNGF